MANKKGSKKEEHKELMKKLQEAHKEYEELIKLGQQAQQEDWLSEEMSQFRWDRPLTFKFKA